MRTLAPEFYARPVLEVARDLIGCTIEHGDCAGVIVETEAYHESEPACHAFVGLTPRTQTLFGEPGRAYVYRSYGVHALLNAVCEQEGVAAAVLIRALHPLAGIERMSARRRARPANGARGGAGPNGLAELALEPAEPRERDLCSGPGKLTQALGVELSENGSSLSEGPVAIRGRSGQWLEPAIVQATRVGITRAVELPWRFCVAGSPHVSRPRPDVRRRSAAWADAAGARRRG